MHHLLAHYTNDLAIGATLTALGSVADPVVPIQNNRFLMPFDGQVLASYVGVPDITLARYDAPSLRQFSLPYITPLSGTALPANVAPWVIQGQAGPRFLRTDDLAVVVTRAGAAVGDSFALSWIGQKFAPLPPRETITVRWTGTITGAEGVWVSGNVTLDQGLYPGLYEVVGMEAYGTNLLAARCIFPAGDLNGIFRPGVLAQGAVGEWNRQVFRFGDMGAFGRFRTYAQPLIEIFCVGANTAQQGYWDLVRIGD